MTFPPWAEKRLADHSSLETPRLVKPAGRVVLVPVVDMSRTIWISITLRSKSPVDECCCRDWGESKDVTKCFIMMIKYVN